METSHQKTQILQTLVTASTDLFIFSNMFRKEGFDMISISLERKNLNPLSANPKNG